MTIEDDRAETERMRLLLVHDVHRPAKNLNPAESRITVEAPLKRERVRLDGDARVRDAEGVRDGLSIVRDVVQGARADVDAGHARDGVRLPGGASG